MMSIFRQTAALLLTIICGTAMGQTPSFFKNLDKGVSHVAQCECVGKSGNLSVGYYKNSRDTLYFVTWDAALKKWINVNKIASDGSIKDYSSKCIYKGDSLIVYTKYTTSGNRRSGIFYLNTMAVTKLADVISDEQNNTVTDLKLYKNNLLVLGNYDSIGLFPAQIKASNASVYNGIIWKGLNFNLNQKTYEFKNLPAAVYNDTALVLTVNSGLIKVILAPSTLWFPLVFNPPINTEITSVTALGKSWMITRKDADSMIYFAGEKISYKLFKNRLSASIHILNSSQGTYISEDGLNGRILKMDTTNNVFQNLYLSMGKDSVSNKIIGNPSSPQFYLVSGNDIYYNNDHFGTMAEINPSLEKQVNLDTVSLFIFNDINGDLKQDIGENITNTVSLTEIGSKRVIKCLNGYFKDLVPDYNSAEYMLSEIEGPDCFKLGFSGGLKSFNLEPNIVHDSLYFPLKKIINGNISVKSSARACARLLDTISFDVKINVDDCGGNIFTTEVDMMLDSNTVLINTSPPFVSKNGSILKFSLNNLSNSNPGIINMKVLYPITKYKIDQLVKHKIAINNSITDDTSDNIDSIVQKIVYSFDPNAKHCLPSGKIKGGMKTIRYYIDFQNEGNSEARRVTVIDTLEAKIPVYEFQMIYCSHPYTVSLKNNVLTWVFDNINLPAKSLDEQGSQGHIIFEARLKKELAVGDSVRNRAFIYFDYNEPVETNTALVVRGIDDPDEYPEEINGQNSLKVFPNPTRSTVSFENKSDKNQEIHIFNTIGQEVKKFNLDSLESLLEPVENWPQGMYFVRSSLGSHHKLLVQ